MASKIDEKECLCSWIGILGTDFLAPLTALIDTAVIMLTTIKVILAAIPANFSDQLLKIQYETELELYDIALGTLVSPVAFMQTYAKGYTDCSPVANINDVMTNLKNITGITALEGRRDIVENYIDALELQGLEIERIDDIIVTLQDFKEAIDECGSGE